MRLPPARQSDPRWRDPIDPEVLRQTGRACSALLTARSDPRIRALSDAEFWPLFARSVEAVRRRRAGRLPEGVGEWADPTGNEAARRADER